MADLELPGITSAPAEPKKGDELDQLVGEILSRPPQKVNERTGFADGSPIVRHTGLLGEVAEVMKRTAEAEEDSFTYTLGVHLLDVAETHHSNDHEWGCCNQCGYGDSPWPCADWLTALTVGMSWLYKRAGL